MRHDMFKVIVERPRWSSRRDDGRPQRINFRRRQGDDEAAAHESMRGPYAERKWLNENLNPLRRWLERQVDRPWDKVFAELCAGIDRRSTVQQHIHQHIDDFVARRVVRVYGVLHGAGRFGDLEPLARRWGRRLYVDPDSGLLRVNRARARIRREDRTEWERSRRDPPADRRDLGEWRQLHRVGGVWYDVALAPVVPLAAAAQPLFDVLLHRPVRVADEKLKKNASIDGDRERYGRDGVYAWRRRQLSGRELRQHGLENDGD